MEKMQEYSEKNYVTTGNILTKNEPEEEFLLTILISTINLDNIIGFLEHFEKLLENPQQICIAIYVDPWRGDIKEEINRVKKTSKMTIIVPDVELSLMTQYGYYIIELCYYYLATFVVPNSRNYCAFSDKARIISTVKPFDVLVKECDEIHSKLYPDRIFSMIFKYEFPIVTKEYYAKLGCEAGCDWGVLNISRYLKKYFDIERSFQITGVQLEPYIQSGSHQTRRGVFMNILCAIQIHVFYRRWFFLKMCQKLFPKQVFGFRLFKAYISELLFSFTKDFDRSRFFSIKKYPYFSRILDSKFLKFYPCFIIYRTLINIASVYRAITDVEIKYNLDNKHFCKNYKWYHQMNFDLYKKIYKDEMPKDISNGK